MNIFLGILLLVMAVFLVVTILLQSSKDHRLSGSIAGGAETFFGKQKGKTLDGILNKLTIVVCIIFFVCVLLMYVLQPNVDTTVTDNTLTPEQLEELQSQLEAEGETAEGETAEGETAEGETAEGETAEGETAEGEAVTEENTEAAE